jgi:Major Facilitator Superfamily
MRPRRGWDVSRRQIFVAFSGAMLGLLLAALDQTIVATALPRIVADLHGLSHLSWVVTAYLITSTVTVPLYGKLSDLYGRKRRASRSPSHSCSKSSRFAPIPPSRRSRNRFRPPTWPSPRPGVDMQLSRMPRRFGRT